MAERLSHVLRNSPCLGDGSGELGHWAEQVQLRCVLEAVAANGLVHAGASLGADRHHRDPFDPGIDHAREQIGDSGTHAANYDSGCPGGPGPGVGHMDLGAFVSARYYEHPGCLGLNRQGGEGDVRDGEHGANSFDLQRTDEQLGSANHRHLRTSLALVGPADFQQGPTPRPTPPGSLGDAGAPSQGPKPRDGPSS